VAEVLKRIRRTPYCHMGGIKNQRVMDTKRTFSERHCFRHITVCLWACLLLAGPPSIVLAKPKGGPSGNNPHGLINPAGILTGSGGIRANPALPTGPPGLMGQGIAGQGSPRGIVNPAGIVTGSGGMMVNPLLPVGPSGLKGPGVGTAGPGIATVNPAGVIIGSGGARSNVPGPNLSSASWAHHAGASVHSNAAANPTGTVPNSGSVVNGIPKGSEFIANQAGKRSGLISKNKWQVTAGPESLFLSQFGSNVVVKVHLPVNQAGGDTGPAARGAGKKIFLAAGDAFSMALTGLDSFTGAVGAEGDTSNPGRGHGKGHWGNGENPAGGVDFNPGGGNGRGRWNEGNNGNGVGNIWVGNQGRGVGGGMAGGSKSKPPQPPEPPEPPEPPGPEESLEPAPLDKLIIPGLRKAKLEATGCPALMKWLANELGIEEDKQIQVYVANAVACSTDIQPCEMAASLKDAATILYDPEGRGIAAIARIVSKLASPSEPLSEEQMASISQVLAMGRPTDAAPEYADAELWLDALVAYVRLLTDELGWSADESIALAIDKYGQGLTVSENNKTIDYVKERLGILVLSGGSVQNLDKGQDTGWFDKLPNVRIEFAKAPMAHIFPFNGLGTLGLAGAMLVALSIFRPKG